MLSITSISYENHKKKTKHLGPVTAINEEDFEILNDFFDSMREAGRKVSVALLVNELKRVNDSYRNISDEVLWIER